MMKQHILFLLTIIILSSCNGLETASAPVSTNTALPTEKKTMPPEITTTFTPRPTLTPLPTSTVTLTALPTMTTSEAENFLLGLYNNNCSLPCWGGFVPGEINWLVVKQKLEAANLDVISVKDGGAASYEIQKIGIKSSIGFFAKNGEIIMIHPEIKSRSYDLQPMLFEYGMPDEVWISSGLYPGPPGFALFGLTLFYKKGIAIEYGYIAKVYQDYYSVCPIEQVTYVDPRLFVWIPDLYPSLEKFEINTHSFGIIYKGKNSLKPLEDATELTVAEFYNNLISPKDTFCIKTPKSLW